MWAEGEREQSSTAWWAVPTSEAMSLPVNVTQVKAV